MRRRPPALFPVRNAASKLYNVASTIHRGDGEADENNLSTESCEHRTPIEKEPTVMVAWEGEKEETSESDVAESNYPVRGVRTRGPSDNSSEDSPSEDERRQMASRTNKRDERLHRNRSDVAIAGSTNLKRESTIRTSNPLRKAGVARQATFKSSRNTLDSPQEGGGVGDGVSNRLHVQSNARAWYNQFKEQSPLLGRNRKTRLNNENVNMSSDSNVTATVIAGGAAGRVNTVDSYVRTVLESPDKQIFPSLKNTHWNGSQPLFPSPVLPPPPPTDEKVMSKEEKAIIKRKNIVNEIYHTEMNYVDFLRRLKDLLDEIVAARKKEEQFDGLKRVLIRAKAILSAHENDLKLVSCLERLVMDWSKNEVISTPISAAFSNAEMKQCYANYILEHSKYQGLIKNWRVQNQAFDSYLTAFEERFPDKLSMESLFLKPIQRLPQLILILQRLLSSCETRHRDRQGLQSAVMSVEQLAYDLNEMKGHHDLTREVDSIRELYCKSHRLGAVDSILPKSDVSRCTRKDDVKVTMISPTPSVPMDGVVILFSRKILILVSKKTDRSERLSAVLLADIGKVQCIGHEIFFKAGMCDSVDPDLMDDWKGVLEDESRLNALKNELEKLNREYRDLNIENIQSAIKEHQALSKDVIQSIKAAGCVDVFFSAEPEPTVKDEYITDSKGVMAFISQWKMTFPSKDDANAWKITLQMLQLANKCRFVTLNSPTDSGSSSSARSLESSTRGGNSPTANKKIPTTDDVVGCWVKTDAERSTCSEPFLSVPLLYSTAKVDVDIINQSLINLIDEENANIVCSVPLTNAPNICPLSVGPKLNSKYIDKPHAEMLLCYGIVWVILSSSEAFCISVYSICESGIVHPLNSENGRRVSGNRSQAFCAVAVPGLDVDDSFVEWAKQQLQDAGNDSKRPRVLNQQSVWIGTSTGITVYKVSSKSGLGSRVFSLPTEYSVMSIAYANGHVVAGLEHGIVNVYTRSSAESSYGAWNRSAFVIHLSDPATDMGNLSRNPSPSPVARNDTMKEEEEVCEDGSKEEKATTGEDENTSDEEVDLGNAVGDVKCIVLPFNDCLKSVADPDQVVDIAWCSAGHNIYIVSILEKKVLFKIQLESPLHTVVSMATVGVCVFVACKNTRSLLMYHAESYRAVSMVNLDKPIAASTKLVPGTHDDSDSGGSSVMTPRRSSRDPKNRLQSEIYRRNGPNARKSSVSSRRGSAFATEFYPCLVTAHSGNLWVGTSSGHLVRFQISKIGLIPNIREGTRLCIYKFSQPVSSIIFTGRKYQAAHQQVVMSQNITGTSKSEANLMNPFAVAKKSNKLNNRKVSVAGSQEHSLMATSQSMLYLAGSDPDDSSGKNDPTSPEEDRQTDSGSFPFDDRTNVTEAFPMLAAKQKKSTGANNSNISHSTYVLALGHNFRSMIPPTNQFFEASQVGANIIAFQVM